jgi:hypothetical protein
MAVTIDLDVQINISAGVEDCASNPVISLSCYSTVGLTQLRAKPPPDFNIGGGLSHVTAWTFRYSGSTPNDYAT